MKKLLVTPQGIQKLDLTAEEITQREQDIIQAEADRVAKEQEETRKATAKQKLIDLGLTEEEIKALIGV